MIDFYQVSRTTLTKSDLLKYLILILYYFVLKLNCTIENNFVQIVKIIL